MTILTHRALGVSIDNFPEAKRLLELFKPEKNESDGHGAKKPKASKSKVELRRFEMTDMGKLLLKGMQITAGITLGILAWDSQDRATAAKRCSEAFDLAACTHAPNNCDPSLTKTCLEMYVANEVNTARKTFATLKANDAAKTSVVGREGDVGRRERLEVINLRMEGDGWVVLRDEFHVATDVCARCGKKQVKIKQCKKCKNILCGCFLLFFRHLSLVVTSRFYDH